jgi:DNA-binding NarL/FixJ family response regulator
VLIADDHPLVRGGLRMLIERSTRFEVVAEASDGREAAELARRLSPDIVVLDVSMPVLNGLDAIPLIRRDTPRARVIVLSMHAAEATVVAALRAGASGYVVKAEAADEIVAAVEAVADGRRYLSPQVGEHLRAVLARGADAVDAEAAALAGLTQRQREVLQQIAEGRPTREIADRLCLSVKTVETHRAELMRRLGIHDVAGLTRLAIRAGLVSAER